MTERLLFLALISAVGVVLYLALAGQINQLRALMQSLGSKTDRLGRRLRRLARHKSLTARIGHMHRHENLPETFAEATDRDAIREREPEWIIVDPKGKVLGRVLAKTIIDRMPSEAAGPADLDEDTVVRQFSNDPLGDRAHHETFRDSLLADAERAARSVFPVCVLRETQCGYDILL